MHDFFCKNWQPSWLFSPLLMSKLFLCPGGGGGGGGGGGYFSHGHPLQVNSVDSGVV